MMSKIQLMAVVLAMFAFGCNSEKSGGEAAGAGSAAPAGAAKEAPANKPAAAADTPCDAVVAKLASYDATAGEAEKKMWTKVCDGMPQEMRACIVASKTKEERDACGKDKPIK